METSPLEIVKLWEHSDRYRERLLERSEGELAEVLPKVEKIVSEVRERGEAALLEFTKKHDGVELASDQIQVSEREISQAYDGVEDGEVDAIQRAAEAVERYHRRQLPEDWMEEFEPGIYAGQVVRPVGSVGAYVPGGRAQYPSSVLMAVIPAKVAGVERVIVCTPPNSEGAVNPPTLIAADVAGADEVYRIGGAQAIALMAYGTPKISSVRRVVGPGSVYVEAAKRVISSEVSIDFMAGPSEVLILADSSADARLVALDLVAQSEHDTSSASLLVTTSEKLAEAVQGEVKRALEDIPRRGTVAEALREHGYAIVVRSLKRAIEFANDYAPEHLQIMVKRAERVLEEVENAGAIFLGPYSPTSAGDYAVGPSHILPTGGEARLYSGLSVHNFVRQPSVQRLTRGGLKRLAGVVERLAELEGLSGHAQSVRGRLEED